MTVPAYAPPPSAAVQLAASQRLQQLAVRTALVWSVIALWRQLDLTDIRGSWPAIRGPLAALVQQEYARSQRVAAAYYRQARDLAGVTGALAIAAPVLDAGQVSAVLDIMGPVALLGRIKSATTTLDRAMQNTGVGLSGATSRLALAGGRDLITQTVRADREAIGWERVAGASACGFCSMLASRGGSYRTEATADFAAHDHCACSAAPVFGHRDGHAIVAAGPADEWRQVTAGLGGKAAINAWRRYQDGRPAAA